MRLNKLFILLIVMALYGCSSSGERADAESLARLHVDTNSTKIARDLAIELTGEHWLLEELGVEWLAVRVVDGIEWTYTKPKDEAGVVAMASIATTTIPVSHERLDRDYTVVVSVPYMLAVDIETETVEATADYVGMTIEHDIPSLPDVDGEDITEVADAARDLLKKLNN